MPQGSNKIIIPPTREQIKNRIIKNYGADFNPLYLDTIIDKYFENIDVHKQYSVKNSIKYISEKIYCLDRIYRKQEILYWVKRGWTDKEAEEKRIVRDKQWYISTLGEIDGLKKLEDKNKKISASCGHTFNRFIKRYGEDLGLQKWIDYKNGCKRNLEFFSKKYGIVEGKIRYEKFIEDSIWQNGYTLDYCIKKYGDSAGYKIYADYVKKITPSLENCIKKYGTVRGPIFLTNWKNTATINLNKCERTGSVSKESLLFFDPIIKWLNGIIDNQDIYVGSKDSREWFINTNSNLYFYDFTIKTLNLIIEYNGSAWHANPQWPDEKLNKWKHPFKKENYKINIDKFNNKINFAKSKGFDVLVIWGDENKKLNLQKCKDFIIKKINDENKNKFITISE